MYAKKAAVNFLWRTMHNTISWVLGTLFAGEGEAEILVIDDQSEDKTFEESEIFAAR